MTEQTMNARSTEHGTFVIERTFDASPARVFAAWADPAAKAKWFMGGADPDFYQLDFRVGGREMNRGGGPEGAVYTYEALYGDIVPDERIAYAYTMDRDETRISVSVATVEFKPVDAATLLILTEQGVFLDGGDKLEHREHGTGILLDKLGAALEG
jgi:uncharacterized protein YndB with AHSA1/START domain